MKKTVSVLLCLALAVCLFASCKGQPVPVAEDGNIKIVTTIFPIYDWIRQILGDNAENAALTMLLDNGVDLHSFQPTASDIIKISTCDLFVYVGGESDEWVNDALKTATNENMIVIDLLSVLGGDVKEEEEVEGMQPEAEEDTDADEPAYDEHVWLSLRNAEKLCGVLADALAQLDPAHAAQYAENTAAYKQQLQTLDDAYVAAVDGAARKVMLFADRFPFRYLADDYGLTYYAAFAGCSAETEASFETIAFLADKASELKLPGVFALDGGDGKIAQTVIANSDDPSRAIIYINSMQSVTADDVAKGAAYLAIAESNLEALTQALS
ncbi:MAG: zinc ABC transporter substrate-binding protein [Clostridia bacterium]|nr:zinc ABC transporter substrate-binding protein [Clostridia bacterium]